MSRSLLLAEDTDLRVISDSCEYFTGADFKALLYNAQLAAIHRITSSNHLYKGALVGSEKGDENIDSERLEQENVVYIPSLAQGAAKDVSADVLSRLQSEVLNVIFVHYVYEFLCYYEGRRSQARQRFGKSPFFFFSVVANRQNDCKKNFLLTFICFARLSSYEIFPICCCLSLIGCSDSREPL